MVGKIKIGIFDALSNRYSLDGFKEGCINEIEVLKNELQKLYKSLYIDKDKENALILDVYQSNQDGTFVYTIKDFEDSQESRINAMYIDAKTFHEVLNKHFEKLSGERDAICSRIDSLVKVRDNVRTLQDWLDIDTFLRELQEEIERFSDSNLEILEKDIHEVANKVNKKDGNRIEISDINSISYGLRGGIRYRYYPILIFGD